MINNNYIRIDWTSNESWEIAFGADSVEESILKRKVKLVIVSEESSERTKSKFIKTMSKLQYPYNY